MPEANSLSAVSGLTHKFFTREDGFSSGVYAGLNCGLGSGDDRETVIRNRNACAESLGVSHDHLLTLKQEHTARAISVTKAWPVYDAPAADALVTAEKNIALGILTADCAPVLFVDIEASVIGAAHAGWKGAYEGVIEATVDAMMALGSQRANIRAAIGPCIGFDSYEVGPEFKARLIQRNAEDVCLFRESSKTDHYYFDLESCVANALTTSGVRHIERLSLDTYTEESRFYSYRRTCHRGEEVYGRQLSAIALVE